MGEPDRQQVGDGSDNYASAAKQAAQAAKQFGQTAGEGAASGAAAASAEAGANAAAATVQAGVEGGKAVAEVAAGTAAGGPWGAILSAAWAMRHTLFKILVCICLFLLILIVCIVSLPSVLMNNIFRLEPGTYDESGPTDMLAIYDDLSASVSDCVSAGYDCALAEVERIIADGGYDYSYSMEALINYAHTSADYDVCYILAAYSVSLEQRGTSKADMIAKLNSVADSMFQVTYVVKEIEVLVEPPVGESEAETEDPPEPTYETVQYVECTIHPFNESVILTAFGIDTSAQYGLFSITCGEAIDNMANALKLTLYGSTGSGNVPPITDEELLEYLSNLDCSATRKEIIRTALSLVGRVPYFWGGKSAAGWNPEWNTPKLVTSIGSSSTGTIRPYGLDCSGFTDWVYKTVFGKTLYEGTSNQWDSCEAITEADLLPGDLGFLDEPWAVEVNHVLIFAGYAEDGTKLWVHCSGSYGVVFNSPDYVKYYRRPIGFDLESDSFGSAVTGEPLYEIRVNVTHYCACSLCCGSNADGITASGKSVARGMVAMSSYYPFGTQIMINGVMYTVEDRGGTVIENDTTRVDIFVPNHQEALRLGRFWADAQIYRIGR